MSGLQFDLLEDGTVALTIPTQPEETTVVLDTERVDEILKGLGNFRANMQPEVPREWQMGGKVTALPDPIWRTEPEMLQGNSLLHLRDPRYGWLHYVIPKAEAKKLGEFLIRQADAPSLEPGPSKAN
jgi:hypothetical protein